MEYALAVNGRSLDIALRVFRVPRKIKSSDRAILGFDGKFLSIDAFDQTILAAAKGEWPGNAHISVTLVRALIQVPPDGDPVILRCDGQRVTLGTVKVGCKWQPVSSIVLARPRQPEWFEGIALKYTLPRARIIAEGRGSEVKAAERKLTALVHRIAKSLAPMGVTVEDVSSLIERRLEERYVVGR
jgi:hypothetical protein